MFECTRVGLEGGAAISAQAESLQEQVFDPIGHLPMFGPICVNSWRRQAFE
jgi:hypothetical protein